MGSVSPTVVTSTHSKEDQGMRMTEANKKRRKRFFSKSKTTVTECKVSQSEKHHAAAVGKRREKRKRFHWSPIVGTGFSPKGANTPIVGTGFSGSSQSSANTSSVLLLCLQKKVKNLLDICCGWSPEEGQKKIKQDPIIRERSEGLNSRSTRGCIGV